MPCNYSSPSLLSLVFLVLVCLSLCCNQGPKKEIVSRYGNGNIGIEKIYTESDNKSSYIVNNYYPDGKLHISAKVANGRYVGEKITYFISGKISQIDSLVAPCDTTFDSCDGKLIRYYENGKIAQEYTIKDHVFNGLSKHYDTNGLIVKMYDLRDDSVKDGIYEEFYPNGRISVRATYKNGFIDGYAYFFRESGDTLKYYLSKDGNQIFPYKKWLENGLVLVGNYATSDKSAVNWKWFDKSNKIVRSKIVKPTKYGFISPD